MSENITNNPSVPSQIVSEVKFPRFINNLGIIPTSYKDSMDYYENLAWLCKYLEETVIPTVNQNGQAVQELQALYIQLNDYVTHYFDNLDVQEEINNKLDDMVESGDLQEIIASYLNSKALFVFETVQDMKEATNLINGSFAKTLGYHSKNDGGSSLYLIRNITNQDVVDNMLILQMENENLIAEYINEDEIIYPEQMGAYGDNTHNDTSILNACITIAKNNGYKIIGNNTYKIESTFNIINDNLDIKINEINYTGLENAIYLKGKENTINITKITSTGVGLYITTDTNTLTKNNKINIDYINSEKHAIYIYSDTWGIYENYFSFIHYIINDSTCYGFYLRSEKTTAKYSYINQTVIYGGRVDGAEYALYCDSTGNGQINELLTYNISGEGCTNGIYLNGVTDSSFENWRLEELTTSSGHNYMKLVGDSGGNNFRFNRYIPLELIDRTELTNNSSRPNMIYGNIRDTREGGYIGTNLKFFGTSQIELGIPKLRSKSVTGDTTLDTYEFVKFFNVAASATLPTITLNGMYGDEGINEFYVYKRSSTTKVIVTNGTSELGITRDGLNHILIVGSIIMVQ